MWTYSNNLNGNREELYKILTIMFCTVRETKGIIYRAEMLSLHQLVNNILCRLLRPGKNTCFSSAAWSTKSVAKKFTFSIILKTTISRVHPHIKLVHPHQKLPGA